MKKLTLIAIPLLISAAGIASAQDNHNLSVRAGYSYFATKDSRDAVSNSGWTAGLSYDLPSKYSGGMGAGSNTKSSIDADYDYHNGNSVTADSWMVQYAIRVAMSNETGHHRGNESAPYFGGGIGYSHLHGSGGGFSDTKSGLGGSVLVGMNFSQNAFLEVAYRIAGSMDGFNFNTFDAVVGMRF